MISNVMDVNVTNNNSCCSMFLQENHHLHTPQLLQLLPENRYCDNNTKIDYNIISTMNVEAMRLFQNGDGRSATNILIHAIRMLQQQQQHCHDNYHITTTSTQPLHRNDDMVYKTFIQTVSISTSSECILFNHSKCNETTESLNGDDYYIYRKPFLIQVSNIPVDAKDILMSYKFGCSSNSIREVCAALMFNLAFIHHEAGIQRGKSVLIQKAVLIYEQALRQIQAPHRVLVLIAAICNNRLHLLSSYYYDKVASEQQLMVMNRTINSIEYQYKLCYDSKGTTIFVDPITPNQRIDFNDLHQFRMSLSFVQIHDFRYSPAA